MEALRESVLADIKLDASQHLLFLHLTTSWSTFVMGKRHRSPSPGTRRLSDLFSLPELFLHVLSFLSPTDLARAQAVNKHWQRMVTDPGLWKNLYLGV